MVVTVSHEDRVAANKQRAADKQFNTAAKGFHSSGRKHNLTGDKRLDVYCEEGEILVLLAQLSLYDYQWPAGQFFRHEQFSAREAGKIIAEVVKIVPTPQSETSDIQTNAAGR